MNIYVKNKKIKKELEKYINYLNQYKIKIIKLNKNDKIYIKNHKDEFIDISNKKIYKFKKFNFDYKIYINKNIKYPKIVTKDIKEFKKIWNYILFLKGFCIKIKLSNKSIIEIENEIVTNKKGYYLPVRNNEDLGYITLMWADIT